MYQHTRLLEHRIKQPVTGINITVISVTAYSQELRNSNILDFKFHKLVQIAIHGLNSLPDIGIVPTIMTSTELRLFDLL